MEGPRSLLMKSVGMPREIPDTSNPAAPTSLQTSGERPSALRAALAGLIGNVLEWFDFAVYGYFATDIGRQFFPKSNATAQQLLAFGVFAIGFFARPVGSVVLGWVGDRIGRRALLTLSIALMGGATLVMGLLPTYAQIGLGAPILLVTMRVIQGFSVGGEFTGAMVFTMESSSPLMRGLVSSSTAQGVLRDLLEPVGNGIGMLRTHGGKGAEDHEV
jgi:MFS transporter, MHS family, proline/betaine transporter